MEKRKNETVFEVQTMKFGHGVFVTQESFKNLEDAQTSARRYATRMGGRDGQMFEYVLTRVFKVTTTVEVVEEISAEDLVGGDA